MPMPHQLVRLVSALTLSCAAQAAGAVLLRAQDGRPAAERDTTERDTLGALPRGARHALEQPGVRWTSRATSHVLAYAKRGSAAGRRLAAHVAASERAVQRTRRWLDAPDSLANDSTDSLGTIRLFFVDSRDEMVPLTSARTAGWALPEEGTAFLVAGTRARPGIRHEVTHLLAWRLWGPPGGAWLAEGVATYALARCGGHTMQDIAAALDRERALVPLDSLREQLDFEGEQGTMHTFQAASLVAYIDQTYGRRRLRAFWRSGGLDGVKRTLGIDAATLEKRWRASVARRSPSVTWARMSARIRERGCE
jgi:hypothetical protein